MHSVMACACIGLSAMCVCVCLWVRVCVRGWVCVCAHIGCSQRSGLMSTGCCHTPLPLLINWLVVDVFGALSSYPCCFSPPPFFWQLSFNHFFVERRVHKPAPVITAAILQPTSLFPSLSRSFFFFYLQLENAHVT